MASVSWTATSSGSWNNAANWSAAPQQGDDVAINTPGSSITVTYSTGSLALDSLTTGAGDTFDMTGGTLSTADGFNLGGALVMSAGTLRLAGLDNSTVSGSISMSGGSLIFAGGATISGGALNQTAGTITINHGALLDQDGGSLAGTLAGSGAFVLSAGQGVTTFQSGFVLATGSVDIASGTVFLQESLNYANKFSLAQAGTLDLNGHAGTLTGYAALDGDINGGSLTVSGGGHLNGMILDNGAVLTVQNSINQTGAITLGGPTGTGTLDITSKGTLRVTGNDLINQGTGAGSLVNSGLIEKTAGNSQAGTMGIYDTVSNAASGIIDAAIGTIDFRGPQWRTIEFHLRHARGRRHDRLRQRLVYPQQRYPEQQSVSVQRQYVEREHNAGDGTDLQPQLGTEWWPAAAGEQPDAERHQRLRRWRIERHGHGHR